MQHSNLVASTRQAPPKTVAVLSAKGGVGKTSITANVGVALARAGVPVLLVDLDPQNALCHHLGTAPDASMGCALATLTGTGWGTARIDCEPGLQLLPYGIPSDEQRIAFEDLLRLRPRQFHEELAAMAPDPATIIIFDTPPGPSIYVCRALEISRLALVVTLPDIASYAAMPGMERLLDDYSRPRPNFIGAKYIVNQANSGLTLARDITEIIKHEFSGSVIGRIHTDQFMREALASRQDVARFAPYSKAARDISACAEQILAVFNDTQPRQP